MSPETTRLLILLRHAKAQAPTPGRADANRPLTERGRTDAEAVGIWLAGNEFKPDLVLCSPARRTRETWAGAVEGMRTAGTAADEATVAYVAGLYSAGVDALIDLVAEIPDEVKTLVVVGHNPTVSIVSAVLDPAGGHDSGLRTAGLAVHAVAGPWKSCGRGMVPLVNSHTARGAEL